MDQTEIKAEIVRQIQRLARAENGVPPGQIKFETLTQIKQHVWRGKLWRNWSEALLDSGFEPKNWQAAYEPDFLINSVIELMKKINRFPTKSDLLFERNTNTDFPSEQSIRRKWNQTELAEKVIETALFRDDHDIVEMGRKYLVLNPRNNNLVEEQELRPQAAGYVYMQKHGSDYKIGYTRSLNKRSRQIQLELPKEVDLVHAILTDDPVGVEAYWHKRFEEKRTRGEWFKLTKTDIAVFKRWTKIW